MQKLKLIPDVHPKQVNRIQDFLTNEMAESGYQSGIFLRTGGILKSPRGLNPGPSQAIKHILKQAPQGQLLAYTSLCRPIR